MLTTVEDAATLFLRVILGDATVEVPLVALDVAIIGGVTFGTRCSLRLINLEIQPFTKKIFYF